MSENTTSATQAPAVDNEIDQILEGLQEALRSDREYYLEEGLDFDDWFDDMDGYDRDDDGMDDCFDITNSIHMDRFDDEREDDDFEHYYQEMMLEGTDTKACVGSTRRIRLGTPRTRVKRIYD